MAKKIKYRLEAMALRIPLALFRLLGLDRASAFGGWLARTIGPKLGVSRRAKRNIAFAMPELAEDEIDRIVTDMWDNLGRTMAEYAHLEKFTQPEHAHRLDIVGGEIVQALQGEGKGAMFVSGHFGNWEVMPMAVRLLGFEGGEVYRHANNPAVNEWIIGLRQEHVMPVQIPKGAKGARDIIKLLRQGKSISMLVDQKMNDGIEATFFGKPAMTTSAPASLAVRYGAAISPACIERTHGANFRMTFYPALEINREAEPFDEVARVTQVLNDFVEERIRARPHEWLWPHNRWPKEDC